MNSASFITLLATDVKPNLQNTIRLITLRLLIPQRLLYLDNAKLEPVSSDFDSTADLPQKRGAKALSDSLSRNGRGKKKKHKT